MNFRVLVFGGEFRTGNEIHLHRRTRRRRAVATFNRIMVSERDAREADVLRAQHQFFRREGAVGKHRVEM